MITSLRSSPNLLTFFTLAIVLAIMPTLVANNYQLSILVFVGLHTILTVGLSLLMGYAGQISLGHAVFFGLGAYGTAALTVHLNWPPLLTVIVSAVVTGCIAYLIAIPIFRLHGHTLAMATLGLNVIFELVAVKETWLTGGPNGLRGIPPFSLGPLIVKGELAFYVLIWLAALLIIAVSLNLVNSRIGRALRAIHASEVAAATVGVNVNQFKSLVLTLSAVYASIAGSLYAFYIGIVSPSQFNIAFSIELVVMVVIGGMASVWGALFGAATVTLLTEALRNVMPQLLRGASGEYQIVVFGLILMLVMIFLPEGLTTGALKRIAHRRWRIANDR
jgi:branched-chain amino acid transport system permease protein